MCCHWPLWGCMPGEGRHNFFVIHTTEYVQSFMGDLSPCLGLVFPWPRMLPILVNVPCALWGMYSVEWSTPSVHQIWLMGAILFNCPYWLFCLLGQSAPDHGVLEVPNHTSAPFVPPRGSAFAFLVSVLLYACTLRIVCSYNGLHYLVFLFPQ